MNNNVRKKMKMEGRNGLQWRMENGEDDEDKVFIINKHKLCLTRHHGVGFHTFIPTFHTSF